MYDIVKLFKGLMPHDYAKIRPALYNITHDDFTQRAKKQMNDEEREKEKALQLAENERKEEQEQLIRES